MNADFDLGCGASLMTRGGGWLGVAGMGVPRISRMITN
ncbi:hypothetical protein VDG1235_1791 [Verrucomicrobiia bacterium DG1235]|nr:hypothetical protein VDG1235_1791 [Verrucomicrobiae bacterium DG1235]